MRAIWFWNAARYPYGTSWAPLVIFQDGVAVPKELYLLLPYALPFSQPVG